MITSATQVKVVASFSDDVSSFLRTKFIADTYALDLEGVNLGRNGSISIIQLATTEISVIFDVQGKSVSDPLIDYLRKLLESDEIVKVIHDCRMDSDALLHHFNIRLLNIHDTSAWHYAITNRKNENLNEVLRRNYLTPNSNRDKSVYKTNQNFWAQRPLTEKMILWAGADVGLLIEVKRLQLEKASLKQANIAIEYESKLLNFARSAKVASIRVKNVGHFIGRGGSNIQSLEDKWGVLVYAHNRGSDFFWVYYIDQAAFNAMERESRK